MKQSNSLTNDSYNSAVFYIGANNDYNLHVVQQGSTESKGVYNLSNAPNSGTSNPQYDMLDGMTWFIPYDTALVSYGDLYLAIDEYASAIENDTLTG